MSWQVDPYHLQVEFSAKHLGMMTVRGHFTDISATGDIDPNNPTASSVNVTIQTASIRTHNQTRDDDLRSSNFLEVEKYPTITFTSTKVESTGPDRYSMTGDLTIKGKTHPVMLQLMRYGEFNDPTMMGHRMAYSGEAEINRKDFGLTFSPVLDGKLVVSEKVKLALEFELVEQKQEQAASTAAA